MRHVLHAVLAQRGPACTVPVEGFSGQDGTCRVIFHDPLEIPWTQLISRSRKLCWDYFEPIISSPSTALDVAWQTLAFQAQNASGNYRFMRVRRQNLINCWPGRRSGI